MKKPIYACPQGFCIKVDADIDTAASCRVEYVRNDGTGWRVWQSGHLARAAMTLTGFTYESPA